MVCAIGRPTLDRYCTRPVSKSPGKFATLRLQTPNLEANTETINPPEQHSEIELAPSPPVTFDPRGSQQARRARHSCRCRLLVYMSHSDDVSLAEGGAHHLYAHRELLAVILDLEAARNRHSWQPCKENRAVRLLRALRSD